MKRERSIVDNRRKQILELIKVTGTCNVEDLAGELNVSPVTIRRDLQYLEDNKKIIRFYGGASIIKEDIQQDEQKGELELYRESIAKHAASLVENGDTIFINTSSTALQLIKYLTDKRVTVITNNGNAINVERSPNVTVILTGGELRGAKEAMVGEFATNNLEKVTAKKSFIGCSGLSLESGMTTERLNEVNVNQLMFQRITGHSYILADHTKIGRNSSFISCSIDQIENVITDEQANPTILNAFKKRGVNVTLVGK